MVVVDGGICGDVVVVVGVWGLSSGEGWKVVNVEI